MHIRIIMVSAIAIALIQTVPVAAAQSFRVAGDENFPPYEFVDADDAFKGFNVDLMKAISLFTDMEFEFCPMPWEDAYTSIESGSIDIIQGMRVTEGRKQHFAFSDTLVQNTDSIYIRADTTGINSFGDLAGKLVGVDYGDMRDVELEKLQGIQIATYQNPEKALLALHAGEVDALVCNTLVINYFSNKHNIASEVMVVGKAFNRRDYAIAVDKDNTELLARLNAGIKAVQESGTYDQLYRKWFGVPMVSREENLRLSLYIIIGSSLVLACITYAYNRVNGKLKQIIAQETAKQKSAFEKLREYDKLQFMDRIISSIAHEIRNPLTSIRLYAEQIPNKIDNPAFMAAVAEDIPAEIERIDALIKEFIEYTAPRKPIQEPIQLREAVESVLSFLHIQLRDISLELYVDKGIVVFFDRNHLRQILLNVLINSIDALREKENPGIEISASIQPSRVELMIRDNGNGADEETMQYLFDPFYTTKSSGNGLGLFIVRQMAEDNGGTVTAESHNQDTATKESGGMTIRITAVRR